MKGLQHGDRVLLVNTHSAALPGTFLAYCGPVSPEGEHDFCVVLTRYGEVTTEVKHVEPLYQKSNPAQ